MDLKSVMILPRFTCVGHVWKSVLFGQTKFWGSLKSSYRKCTPQLILLWFTFYSIPIPHQNGWTPWYCVILFHGTFFLSAVLGLGFSNPKQGSNSNQHQLQLQYLKARKKKSASLSREKWTANLKGAPSHHFAVFLLAANFIEVYISWMHSKTFFAFLPWLSQNYSESIE